MAILSNINDKFAVDSTGAIQFNGQAGTSGYILKSNGNTAPTWVDPGTVIGGPYLPLTGGTLTGNLAISGSNSLTVGGISTFAGDVGIGVTPTKELQVSGEALFGNGTDGLLLSYSGGNSSGIIDTGHSSTALEFRVGNTQELLINGSSATFAGNGTFGTVLNVIAPDGGGSPAMTATMNMHGYDGRGVGIKMKDNVTTSGGGTDREWFVGSGYNQSGFNIGYASDGSQSSYAAQAKLSIGTNGNVGIGTTSPTAKLDISGMGSGGVGVRIKDAQNVAGSYYYGFMFDGTDIRGTTQSNIFYAGGSVDAGVTIATWASMRIDTPYLNTGASITNNFGIYQSSALQKNYFAGNVGIGTGGYAQKPLDISGASGGQLLITSADDSVGSSAGILLRAEGGEANGLARIKAGIFFERIAGTFGNGDLKFAVNTSVNNDAVTVADTKMTIDSTGKVGINTTSPANKLNVNGDIGFTGFLGQGSIFGNTSNSSYTEMQLYNPANGFTTIDNKSYGYYFKTGGGTKVTILNNGNVGIGGTSPGEKLEVNGNIKAADTTGKFFTNTYIFSGVVLVDFFQHTNAGIWEYTLSVNPNTAGSASYTDYYYGKIGVGIGWNGSTVTQYLWHQPTNTAPRTLYGSGGGNLGLSFQMLYSGSVYTNLPLNTGPWYLRLTGLGTSVSGQIYFRRLA